MTGTDALRDYLLFCLELDAYLEDQAIPQPSRAAVPDLTAHLEA